jgi:hypothetical protein
MPDGSWLFVKGADSIWVERPHGRLMVVAGPGAARDVREFDDDPGLEAFQVQLAERLTSAGWFLWGVNRERRQTADRRKGQRGTPDRRQGIARG